MSERIVVDPVTRIEGHLKVEVEIAGGKIVDARSSGTMARGFEVLLEGRDPRDATYVTERICGVCAGSHGWVSSVALDNAYGVELPTGGRILRNLILGAMWLHDHPLHFYHLSALDYLDVLAVAGYQGHDPALNATRDKLVALVKAGDTSPLTPRYQPDEFSVKDPEIVTAAVAHYLKALEMQAKAKKMSAIFGGKQPHQSSIVVGGVTMMPNAQRLAEFRSMLLDQLDFVEKVYLPDVLAFGTGPLLPLAQLGVGGGRGNFLSYGVFPEDNKAGQNFLPAGVITNGQLAQVQPVDQRKVTEAVHHSWYAESIGTKHPWEGRTAYDLDKADAYSFIKAPRYDGQAMEVGALARMLVLKPPPLMQAITTYKIKVGAVARHAARAVETVLLARRMLVWIDELAAELGSGKGRIHDTAHWETPAEAQGIGMLEAPRGALGHWVKIADKKIKHYQIVVPTTWNCSPRDEKGQRGPVEEALIGTPVPDPKNPINVVRVIRSFDPCIACAVHVIEPRSNEILKFRIA